MLSDGAFLVLFYGLFSGDSLDDYTAGRCCLHRAMVRVIYLYVVYPTHCHARLGEQYYYDSIQVTIKGAILRCQWACHQCLPNTLASYMFWSPPIVVHHWSGRLPSRHRGSCNPWCPRAPKPPASAEESTGITPRERGSHSSGIREATQCTTRHSWQNALFLLRGQMVAYCHGWATVPRRERAATCPHKKTSHALGYGSFRLGTHDARTSCIPLNGYKLQCFWGG